MTSVTNPATTAQTHSRIRPRRLAWRRNLEGWLFASPWIIGFVLWTLGPMLASLVIAYNAVAILRASGTELMDRAPGQGVIETIRFAAEGVPGVLATEKIAVRKSGIAFRVTLHVQASPAMSLHEAHVLGGKVKAAIRSAEPRVDAVLVHLEPFERSTA